MLNKFHNRLSMSVLSEYEINITTPLRNSLMAVERFYGVSVMRQNLNHISQQAALKNHYISSQKNVLIPTVVSRRVRYNHD